ncbi:unnamed protein product [Mycena citricolor]|uniref:GAG-pre-integrase domain-containing protein n=1 Tax=Mycena citricolor TaxID=2018698 RepID=A0AAD2K3K6_9AGAR|nr:unnamed protein product [Mycena citricolor]
MTGSTAVKHGGNFAISGRGEVELVVRISSGELRRVRFAALHTPGFGMNLVLITTLDSRGCRGSWGGGVLTVVNPDGVTVMDGRFSAQLANGRRLYSVDVVDEVDGPVVAIAGRNRKQPTTIENWHRRLGHAEIKAIRRMATKGCVMGLDVVEGDVHGMCKDCILGKQDKMPFDDEVVHEREPLERVHLDLWGRARTPSWGNAVYLMLILDGGTSMKFPVFLTNKRKETVLEAFSAWLREASSLVEPLLARHSIK